MDHRCKVCSKSFPCGRSLGGHMRSHVTSSETDEPPLSSHRNIAGVGAGYGLRENPKKTARLFDSGPTSPRGEKHCKDCGKGFPSWKALFGHMRCHSTKGNRGLKEEQNQEHEQEQEQSDDEVVGPMVLRRKPRSRRTMAIPAPDSPSSEFDSDQVDAAISLVMLSRDVGHWSAVRSVVLESKESDEEGVGSFVSDRKGSELGVLGNGNRKDGLNKIEVCVSDDGFARDAEFKKPKVGSDADNFDDYGEQSRKCCFNKKNPDCRPTELGVLGNGNRKNGLKKIEACVSDDGFVRDGEFKKLKLGSDADNFDHSDEQLRNGSFSKKNMDWHPSELGKKRRSDHSISPVGKFTSSKGERFDSHDCRAGLAFDTPDGDSGKTAEGRSRYECTTCNKSFHSYQALGGHRASHKRLKAGFKSSLDASENSLETDASVDGATVEERIDQSAGADTSHGSSKKIKSHECTICGKVFQCGQALGGHKRSHFVASAEVSSDGNEVAASQSIVIQPPSVVPDLLDLNLPAPIDGGSTSSNRNSEFTPWWVGSNIKQDLLLGMITNP